MAEWEWAVRDQGDAPTLSRIQASRNFDRRSLGPKTYRFPELTRFIIIAFGIGGLGDETDDDKWTDTSVSSMAHAHCRLQPSATRYFSLSSQPLAKNVVEQKVANRLSVLSLACHACWSACRG